MNRIGALIACFRAGWRDATGRGRMHEYPFPQVLRIAVQRADRSTGFKRGFSFWVTDDDAVITPGDTLRVWTEQFGTLSLLVVQSKKTDRHGTYGVGLPTPWQQHVAMEEAWKDFRRQADRELQGLRNVIWALVAERGGACEIDMKYFRAEEAVDVELVPGDGKIFVKVTERRGEETVQYG